jgi:MoaA/NifB/PqqE/SkfB family radical SAM enzyme
VNRSTFLKALPAILLQAIRRRPLVASVNVTNRCTERCPMCSVWRTELPEMKTERLLAAFAELRRFGIRIVEISGGEPFLRPDLGEIVAALDRHGFLYTLTTNATVLPEGTIETLRRGRGLLQLAVSLDSLDPQRYALLRGADLLPRVLENLERLAAARMPAPLKLNVTVSRINVDDVPMILEFARERGMSLSAFPVNVGAGFHHRDSSPLFVPTEEERKRLADLFRDLSARRRRGEPLWEYSGFYDLAAEYVEGKIPGACAAGDLYLDLRADGGVAPCVDLPAVGTIGDGELETVWRKMKAACAAGIERCWRETPCCYTCTYNLITTKRNRLRFFMETVRLHLGRRRSMKRPSGMDVPGIGEK